MKRGLSLTHVMLLVALSVENIICPNHCPDEEEIATLPNPLRPIIPGKSESLPRRRGDCYPLYCFCSLLLSNVRIIAPTKRGLLLKASRFTLGTFYWSESLPRRRGDCYSHSTIITGHPVTVRIIALTKRGLLLDTSTDMLWNSLVRIIAPTKRGLLLETKKPLELGYPVRIIAPTKRGLLPCKRRQSVRLLASSESLPRRRGDCYLVFHPK